jgi:methyl-accepting chemotaxis protein
MTLLRNMTIGTKLAIALAVLAGFSLSIAGVAIQTMSSYQAKIEQARRASVTAQLAEQINGNILASVMDSRGIFMSSEPKPLKGFADLLEKTLVQMNDRVERLRRLADAEDLSKVDAIKKASDQFIAHRRELIRIGIEQSGAASKEFGYSGPHKESRVALSKAVQTFADENAKDIERFEAELDSYRAGRLALLIGLTVGGILIAGALAVVIIVGSVTRPLNRMSEAMTRVAGGDYAAAVPGADRKDEIGKFAASLQVFRDNALERERLRDAQIHEEAARVRRQNEVDQLIGFFGKSVGGIFQTVSEASGEMSRTATALLEAAVATDGQADLLSSEAQQTAENLHGVAAAAQQLSVAIGGIGTKVERSTRIATDATEQAATAVTRVENLRSVSEHIGAVVDLIGDVAGQTNLLALNATIEAARAGEAGKGFAVVAHEVKNLASQTSAATQRIHEQITAMQAAAREAADSIQAITTTITEMHGIASEIAQAVTEQGGATHEIAYKVAESSESTAKVSSSVNRVKDETGRSQVSSKEVEKAADALSQEAQILSAEVSDFLEALKRIGDDQAFRTYTVDIAAAVRIGDRSIDGRVTTLSSGALLFSPAVDVAPGTPAEVRLQGVAQPLRARFAERGDGGSYFQLPLDFAHLDRMAKVLVNLGLAA